MKKISNPSVNELAKILMTQLLERGFAMSAVDRANLYTAYLSDFMEKNNLQVYDESIGAEFLKDLSPRFSAETNGNLKLFITRVNAILRQERFVTHVKTSEPIKLPASFENILTDYVAHCKAKGLHPSTIRKREFCYRAFLNSLAHTGIHGNIEITHPQFPKRASRKEPSGNPLEARHDTGPKARGFRACVTEGEGGAHAGV
ncbi:MAG: hypothetical protein HFF26_09890 [Oscillospiraceae bacterium]|nr:hypothetical protein [Oscillospiraceae bacterium]